MDVTEEFCLSHRGSMAERNDHTPEVRAAAERSYPTPEVRGGSQEEQPHIQGAAAAHSKEGREELLHVQGQKKWPGGDTPCPR